MHRNLLVTSTMLLALATIDAILADRAAAGEVRSRFVDQCVDRETDGAVSAAAAAWIALFCQREADLRYARFAVAPVDEQRAIISGTCTLGSLLGPLRAASDPAVDIHTSWRVASKTCEAVAARLVPTEAPPHREARQSAVIPESILATYGEEHAKKVVSGADLGRSVDAAATTRP